jgi:hypothetical protein
MEIAKRSSIYYFCMKPACGFAPESVHVCVIFGEESGTEIGFAPSLSIFSCPYNFPVSPYSCTVWEMNYRSIIERRGLVVNTRAFVFRRYQVQISGGRRDIRPEVFHVFP